MSEVELIVSHEEDGRTYYEPVVATVKGYSEYNKDQISLTTAQGYIKGYWSLAPKLAEKMGTPKIGTKAEWYLATKPKTSEKAKPGSLYYDVVDVRKVPDSYDEPIPTANERADATARQTGAITDDQPLPAKWTMPLSYFREHDATERASIQAQTAFNGLVALLKEGAPNFDTGELDRLKFQLRYVLNLLVPGLPESAGANAARTDAEVGDAEDLPWEPPAQPKGSGTGWPQRPADATLKATQPEMATGAETKRASH